MKYVILFLFAFIAVNQLSAQNEYSESIVPYYQTVEKVPVGQNGGSGITLEEKFSILSANVKDEYVRDSLRILLVKLMGLKKLDEKNLLFTDVKDNFDYYSVLLAEFKTSAIDPIDYLYLEQTCNKIANEKLKSKYNASVGLNIILGLGMLGLLIFVLNRPIISNEITAVELSNQELKVKNLILEGRTNKEIATILFVSLSTVKTHISNLYKKEGVNSRSELMKK